MADHVTSPPRARGSRIPPHDLTAEESLLGAMMLEPEAIAAAASVLRAEDFYKPAHTHIFDAIHALYASGQPVDPVTVADELRRNGLLETVGGHQVLVDIMASTPATTNAGGYARIVEEHALLRRLIGVAGEVAEIGYSMPDDVDKALDRAESMVYEVNQRRVVDSTSKIEDLLGLNLDRLEQLYSRGDAITGIPTGYLDLDDLLSGLQPSNLVVVGARPSMGKALALDTPLPTPTGWTTMGDVRVGDQVFDDQGQVCTVTYVSPIQLQRRCYEVEFDDGSVLVADADHQWAVTDAGGSYEHLQPPEPRVVTTQQMRDEGVRRRDGGASWHVPVAQPLDLPEADLPTDPYVLGGRLADTGHPDHGLIPGLYMRAAVKQRLALVDGVLETHPGARHGNGTVELCLADLGLLRQVRELLCSLGYAPEPIRPTAEERSPESRAAGWRLSWTGYDEVMPLASSARAVRAIRPVASVPVRCITVDSPSRMYLAGETMVPTHNTSFGLGMAAHAALYANQPVLVFSLEMGSLELSQRLLCGEARIDSARVRNGRLNEDDWSRISQAIGRLASAPIWIDDNPNLTVMEIRAKARRLKSQVGGLGMVVVDYLQLMTGRSKAENRQVEVSEISRGLKILARELECPVVALSQLSRQLELRADKRPMLADLRESGSIEQDSDVVIFIYRDDVYNPDSPDRGQAEIIVSKHRNGPTGVTRLAFLEQYTRFANMARVD
jgi:replicative DNA helicase